MYGVYGNNVRQSNKALCWLDLKINIVPKFKYKIQKIHLVTNGNNIMYLMQFFHNRNLISFHSPAFLTGPNLMARKISYKYFHSDIQTYF